MSILRLRADEGTGWLVDELRDLLDAIRAASTVYASGRVWQEFLGAPLVLQVITVAALVPFPIVLALWIWVHSEVSQRLAIS